MLRTLISGGSLANVIIYIISSLFVIFCTQPVHEFAHAWMANKLGDPTARYRGRMTLNPMAHINLIGAGMILLFGFGWAEPVPVNQMNFRRPKSDMALTALAGPVSNVILAFICLLLGNIAVYVLSIVLPTTAVMYIWYFFSFAAQINVTLAVFNLLPVPPLDGSRILFAVLPDKYYYKLQMYEQYVFIAVLVLCMFGAFNGIISGLSSFLINGLDFIASLPFRLFY